jgi:hypothetical protein
MQIIALSGFNKIYQAASDRLMFRIAQEDFLLTFDAQTTFSLLFFSQRKYSKRQRNVLKIPDAHIFILLLIYPK